MIAACITLAPTVTYAANTKTIATVEGWNIKSRTNADGKFLACSMERFFLANKGDGRFRINIIAWPESLIVLLRGNGDFLKGEGVGRFDIVSSERQLYSGSIRYKDSEVLFALNGNDTRQQVAASRGWSVSMDGKRIARFPMDGAEAAMAAVEKCAGLDLQIAASETETPAFETAVTVEAENPIVTHDVLPSSAVPLADARQLKTLAHNFSLKIGRPDFRVTRFDSGVLQWSYGDDITSGAATVIEQSQSAGAYAAGLAIRPDQCTDSVLTLPLMVQPLKGGAHAAVVSMCRGKASVTVRHVHVVKLDSGASYVLNYETEANPDGTDMPERSDVLASAFGAALTAAVGG